MLYSVQYLRAVAAVLVVVCHVIHKQGQLSGSNASWEFGGSGVDLFFIISGFIMCHVTDGRRVAAFEFLKARVLRIIPLYWVLSAVALAIYLYSHALVNSSGGVTSIVNSFTLIPNGEKFLIQTGWTLSYEFWFYLIFASTLSFPRKIRLPMVCGLLVSLPLAGRLFPTGNPFVQFATHPLLLEFMMGIFAFQYVKRYSGSVVVDVAVMALGAALLAYFDGIASVENRVLVYGLPYMFMSAGFMGLERFSRRVSGTFVGHVAKALGDSSYSLYLSHPFVLAATSKLLALSGVHVGTVASCAFLSLTAIGVGYACHRVLELNLNSATRSVFDRSIGASSSRV
ncbi:acyltransferase family protein [Burkholderia sp. A9]|uniref:acyltransferase family protein n=1 Tax=Burkholderia sp. A9 TaxID=1365108 RepID=UPI00069350F8|nr:acyltransferase [Burkholderia sp. A9]